MTSTIVSHNTLTATAAIGETIAQHLRLAGLTRRDLGALLGTTSQNISGRIRGRSKWTAEELLMISYALGITVNDLMPAPDGHGGWLPAPYVPGTKEAPTEVRAILAEWAHRDSNPEPTGSREFHRTLAQEELDPKVVLGQAAHPPDLGSGWLFCAD